MTDIPLNASSPINPGSSDEVLQRCVIPPGASACMYNIFSQPGTIQQPLSGGSQLNPSQQPQVGAPTSATSSAAGLSVDVSEGLALSTARERRQGPQLASKVSGSGWANNIAVLTTAAQAANASMQSGAFTSNLFVSGFGFNIPSGATIQGIRVKTRAKVVGSVTSEKVQIQSCAFVAPSYGPMVAADGTTIYTSSDGTTFTNTYTFGATVTVTAVASSTQYIVMVGTDSSGNPTTWVSTDSGLTFAKVGSAPSSNLLLYFTNGLFILADTTIGAASYSTKDGSIWTQCNNTSKQSVFLGSIGSYTFFADSSYTTIYFSSDATNFSSVVSPVSARSMIAFDGTYYYFLFSDGSVYRFDSSLANPTLQTSSAPISGWSNPRAYSFTAANGVLMLDTGGISYYTSSDGGASWISKTFSGTGTYGWFGPVAFKQFGKLFMYNTNSPYIATGLFVVDPSANTYSNVLATGGSAKFSAQVSV